MIAKNLFPLIVVVSVAFGQDRWYPMRFEYSNCGYNEIGMSSGIWWSRHQDILPLDAYGPTIALKAFMDDREIVPGVQLGLEANALFLCARVQCGVYKARDNTALTLFSPQVGLTWISLVNLYVGYNKQISGSDVANMNELSLTVCVNLPSYFFGTIQ